jgi:hypothetical protein
MKTRLHELNSGLRAGSEERVFIPTRHSVVWLVVRANSVSI